MVNLSVVRYTWVMGSKGKQKEFLEELFYRDRIVPTWKNLGEKASRMYDDPQEAFDILQENADKTLKTINLKRFHLTQFIEDLHFQLKSIMFLVGAQDIKQLKSKEYVITEPLTSWIHQISGKNENQIRKDLTVTPRFGII